jgi:hypothetical protein
VIDHGSQPQWKSVAAAARALEITETAVRKRIRAGVLSARGDRGATEVLILVANSSQSKTDLVQSNSSRAGDGEAARLAAELIELRARLADLQLDRDRWHTVAIEAREDARAAAAARDAVERELRMLLGRVSSG